MASAIHDIPLTTIDGKPSSLGAYNGKVLLCVNVASKCGLTPQYAGLEKVHTSYRDRGFAVLGFPANDFAGQEPGTNAEIADFCRTNYSVDFPMFSKIAVTGTGQHPLYAAFVAAQPKAAGDPEGFRAKLKGYGIEPNPAPGVLWNFEKFLVGRNGSVVARFAPDLPPDDPAVTRAIEAELGR
jgi:glutathione peroxidase